MKKLLTICAIAVGLMIPLAFNSNVQAEPPPWAGERHPEIHQAIHALEIAKTRMQQAEHDFGGHREAALHACDAAVEQLRLALKYER